MESPVSEDISYSVIQRRMRHYLRRYLPDEAIEDVVQDVWERFWHRRPDGLTGEKDVARWLYRVAHNRAVDIIRKRSRETLVSTESVSHFPAPSSGEKKEQLQAALWEAAASYPGKVDGRILLDAILDRSRRKDVLSGLNVSDRTIRREMEKFINHISAALRRNGWTPLDLL